MCSIRVQEQLRIQASQIITQKEEKYENITPQKSAKIFTTL